MSADAAATRERVVNEPTELSEWCGRHATSQLWVSVGGAPVVGRGWGWGHEDQEAVIVQEGTRLHGRSNLQLGDEGPLGRRYNRAGRLGG